jgi:hypothetical protein
LRSTENPRVGTLHFGHHCSVLDHVVLLVAPLFNADGNDRLDPEHRKLEIDKFRGQIGPTCVGTREKAAGVNLNRDYMRQQGAEMRLKESRVCHPWNPHLREHTSAILRELGRSDADIDSLRAAGVV